MKLELKNVKISQTLSEETMAFTATLYSDGRKAGGVKNHGHGGSHFYVWCSPEQQKQVEDWVAQLPVKFNFERLDQCVDALLAVWDLTRQMQRLGRKSTLFRLKSDEVGLWSTIKKVYSSEVKAFLHRKYGNRLECIANEDFSGAVARQLEAQACEE